MKEKIDPFTRTPGIAGKAYIDNGIADEIINNFCSEESSKYVYKITGLRGSGKSVEYGRVIRCIKEQTNWLVYTLSAAGDAVSTLIAKMSMEKFIKSQKTDTEKKVLIGIDDIAKTNEMIKLLSIIGSMILEGLPIYLLVTGISENIEYFSTEKNLTFFKKADVKEITLLNRFDVTYMYEKLLGINTTEAKKLEELSNDYAYAYQVLGSLYYTKEDDATIEDIIPDFERILFKDSYDLIWQSLTDGEKEIVRLIYKTERGKADEIKALMKNPGNYSVYRNRLINKHLVDASNRGYLKIRLPRFDKFIELWGE